MAEETRDPALVASLDWSCNQVADWIASLGFEQYKECFRSNMINGRKLIRVDASTLPNMGVTDFDHVTAISRSIRKLLDVEDPDWSRSITLPHRDSLGMFLEGKSHTGVTSDKLEFEEQEPNPAAKTGYLRLAAITLNNH
ncbi:sterile alpha motif domain-containing protein 15-like [Corticium candelabrum]|uniref:sterile alpha motif domain-containing protein 15-like n=1 Tax=Corticium candelabrum TaxID=121492 RepID=UPI002E2650C0|nr:sterile alpha motif domain-containing protein 15-like [Corticium candelabrum]